MRRFVQGVGDDPASSPGLLQSIFGSVASSATTAVTNQLPTKTEVAASTVAAIVTFWIVGGITLWLVLGRKR